MRSLLKMTWMEAKLFLREPVSAFFTLIFPLLMLFLFGTIYGNQPAAGSAGQGTVDTLIPAFTAMIIGMTGLMSVTITMATYRENGVLRRLRQVDRYVETGWRAGRRDDLQYEIIEGVSDAHLVDEVGADAPGQSEGQILRSLRGVGAALEFEQVYLVGGGLNAAEQRAFGLKRPFIVDLVIEPQHAVIFLGGGRDVSGKAARIQPVAEAGSVRQRQLFEIREDRRIGAEVARGIECQRVEYVDIAIRVAKPE